MELTNGISFLLQTQSQRVSCLILQLCVIQGFLVLLSLLVHFHTHTHSHRAPRTQPEHITQTQAVLAYIKVFVCLQDSSQHQRHRLLHWSEPDG